MTTYAQLQTDIADWMEEDVSATRAQGFIRLAEAEMRRDVRVSNMIVTGTLACTSRSTALPDRWLGFRSVTKQDGTYRRVDFMPPEKLREDEIWQNEGGDDTAYTIEGDNLVLAPDPMGGTVTLDIVYWQWYEALSDSNTSTWLTTNAYDMFLYCCLKHAAIYYEDDTLAAKYSMLYMDAKEALNRTHKIRQSSGSSRIRTGGDTP